MSRAWMPIYWGDYFADTRHLTTLQHGAYLLLIAHYWQHGDLPDDPTKLKQICGMTHDQWRSNCQALAKLFLPGWKHKRVDLELQKANDLSLKRSVFGKKGGLASRGKDNNDRFVVQAIAKQMGHQSQSHIEREGVAEKKEPVASSLLADNLRARGWAS